MGLQSSTDKTNAVDYSRAVGGHKSESPSQKGTLAAHISMCKRCNVKSFSSSCEDSLLPISSPYMHGFSVRVGGIVALPIMAVI